MNLAALLLDTGDEAGGVVGVLFIIFICCTLYFLPSILAWSKPDFGSVAAINFFLGWTLVGWVVALAWALKGDKPNQVILQNPAPMSLPVLCPGCGKYSQGGSHFCSQCGMKWAVR